MTTVESYILHRKRTRLRLWTGYMLANAAFLGMMALVWYW